MRQGPQTALRGLGQGSPGGKGLTWEPSRSATFFCRAWTWASGGRTSQLCAPAHSPLKVQLPEGVRLGFIRESGCLDLTIKKVGVWT